jgi:uncharacterized protein (TIGR04255 family)
MAKQQHLSKAPITEALIDIRATLPNQNRDMRHLAALADQFRSDYPEKKTIHEFQYKVKFGAQPTEQKTTKQELGYRLASRDNTQVIQAAVGGLTFSRLPPYQEWAQLRDEAKRVWKIYAEDVRPENITRVATRYINKLELPGPHVDFDHYLNYVPRVPSALPQLLGGFFSRVVVPDPKSDCTAIMTQMFQPSQKESEIVVILDIDVFRERLITEEADVWSTLESLRNLKNLLFFDSITEECVRLYL